MPKKILVIDDEALVARSLSKLLSACGFDVVVASSGHEALQKIKDEDFHLIISDIRMPELDGIETVKQIRGYLTCAKKKKIPEIFITGYADKERYETALAMGVSEYIYKPFEREYILRVVERTIR